MGRGLNKLAAVAVRNGEPGKYADGGGLWLHRRVDGGAQWVLRVTIHGVRREMGLGSTQDVSLKTAREESAKWRSLAKTGIDPIRERLRLKREAARNLHLLRDVAKDAFESRKAELKGDGIAGRWFSPVELHVLPKLGHLPIGEVDQIAIRDALRPIWHKKAVTARKALNRLAIIFRHAAALGIEIDLQAPEKAVALLGAQRHTTANIPAMPWQDVPAFYKSINDSSVTHLALRLLILTGVRSRPLRFLHEDQIVGDVWTIPGEAMKGRKGKTPDFRVPLSKEALGVIAQARPHARGGFLFPSTLRGVISDMTMARLMERAKLSARPHGFRSSLRDFAEATNTPHDVAETALGHIVGGAVERAYRRTDFLEQRRILLARWSSFLAGQTGRVVNLLEAAS